MSLRSLRYVLWGLCGVFAVMAAGLVVWQLTAARRPGAISSGVADIGGPFEMVDSTGAAVTEADLLGKPVAIFFGFTYCPDVCPTTLSDLSGLMEALGADADKLNVVFVTVDPERDTPEVVGAYLSSFDPRIRGLTGTPEQVRQIAEAYRVFYERVPTEGGDYTINHTATVYLMDAKGEFAGTLDYQESRDVALTKLKRLVGEV